MRLPVLALFVRSLRTESRARSTYAVRFGLVLLVFVALIVAHGQGGRATAAGLGFFIGLAYLNLVFITGAGLTYFSSAITEEKEEETLGLLKMSNLNSVAILLGKSTSRLLGVLMLLLTQVPFTLLAVTLGGVSLNQLACAYATMLSYTVLLANLSLLSSVVMPRTRKAAGLSGFVVLLFLAAPAALFAALPYFASVGWISVTGWVFRVGMFLAEKLIALNPFVRTHEVLTSGFAGTAFGFQVLGSLVGGAALFLLAWLAFERFTREQKGAAAGRGFVFRRTSLLRCLGVGRPWRMPLAWKDFHFMAGGRLLIAARVMGIGVATLIVVRIQRLALGRPVAARDAGAPLMLITVVVAGIELINHAGRMIQEEIKWGTLGGLFLLPKSAREIVNTKFLGVLPALVPYAVAFLVGAVLDPESLGRASSDLFGQVLGIYLLLQSVALLFFTALLSLYYRRIGSVLAVGLWFFGNMLVLTIVRPGTEGAFNALAIFESATLMALIAVFYGRILRRVEELAGQ